MRISYKFFNVNGRSDRLGHRIETVSEITGMTSVEIMDEVKAGRLKTAQVKHYRRYELVITRESLAAWLEENELFRTDLNKTPDSKRLSVNELVRFSGLSIERIRNLIRKGVIPVLPRRSKNGKEKYWVNAGALKKSQFVECCPETVHLQKLQSLIVEEPVFEPQKSTKHAGANCDLSTVEGILAEFGKNNVRIIVDGDNSAFIHGKHDVVERLRSAFDEKRDDILKRIFAINNPERAAIGVTIAYLKGLKEKLEVYYNKASYAEGEVARLKKQVVRLKAMRDRASSSTESKEVSRVPAPEATGCVSQTSPALPAGGLRAVFRRFFRVREAA